MSADATAIPGANRNERLDPIGLLHLGNVVLVGSTAFLAIRLAVRPEGGFPPLTLGAPRCAVAAIVLGLWVKFFLPKVAAGWRAVLGSLISGAVLWGGGNGLSAIASKAVGSGTVALFFATAPLWVAVLESVLRRRWPSRSEAAAMLLGSAGLTVLSAPRAGGVPSDPALLAALLAAPLFFALGVVILRRSAGPLGGLRAAALQLAAGAGVLGGMSWLASEPAPTPTPLGWWMWSWLTLAGAVLGFPSFAIALKRLPTAVFMAHAWINPILATILGVVVAGESLSGTAILAAGLVGGDSLPFGNRKMSGLQPAAEARR